MYYLLIAYNTGINLGYYKTMRKYTITEVSQMIGVKVHVIRYWEAHSGLFAVWRDENGKRLYEWKDILLLMQFEYFVNKKQYSVKQAESALVQLLQELRYAQRRSECFPILKEIDSQRTILHKAQHILLELKALQKTNV